jgi:tetratricopeptide (TPR) repeat protein
MNYPGNANLSPAVKDRVVSTFQQTLALYHQRRTDEVVAGCTLILQMDPVFDPARKLLEKTRNPASPIDVDSLLPSGGNSAMQQAREAMARRDFETVARITSEILSDDLLNDDARVLGDEAREKLEAAPFVEQFTRRADQSVAAGNIAAAKMELEKARALDPTHPEVIRVAQALTSRGNAPAPAAASPSFIVDDAKGGPGGRSTAQAADFGFAFEEEQAPAEVSFGDFSFDTPGASADSPFSGGFSFDGPSSAASGPGNEFDFATATVITSSDDQKKIGQYLADGDRAFASGDYQQAVDLWSRIFLIDVTNEEASDRIEHAKAKRREIEQSVDPLMTSGITAFDRGNTAKAQADFAEVLRLDPQNTAAQDYLDRLSAQSSRDAAAAEAYLPPSTSDDNLGVDFFDEETAAGPYQAPLIPPAPPSAAGKSGKTAAAPARAKRSSTSARKLPMGAIAAVIGVIVLLAGGWFAWQRFSAEPEAEADGGAGQALIARASTLAGAGKYDQAIALLQNIKPSDPQHDEALVMIADLRARKSGAAQLVDGIPADQFFNQHLTAARTAFDAHDYVVAKTEFEQATRVKPLPADLKAQYDAAAQQVAKLDSAKALFNERKFAEAIANLQPLLDQDPQNQAIRRMIVDAHFNSGAVALQEERLPDAIRAFDEVLRMSADDELARRSRELAVRYDGEPKDLLYRIYVKYLPLRQTP